HPSRIGVVERPRDLVAVDAAVLDGVDQRRKTRVTRRLRSRAPDCPLRSPDDVCLPSRGPIEQFADPSWLKVDDLFGPIEADAGAQLLGCLMHRREGLMHGLEGPAHLAAGTKA